MILKISAREGFTDSWEGGGFRYSGVEFKGWGV